MKIKICGLMRVEDAYYVSKAHVDYAGMILSPGYRRSISIDTAKNIKNTLDSHIKCVGVFVNEDINNILLYVENHIIDMIQLHGNEDQDYIKELRSMTDIPIIKKISLFDKEDYDVDYYLLDNIIPGSGQSFDWSLIPTLNKPFFLAGGINIDNITEAKKTNAYALDLSSGVEVNGIKNEEKINEIVGV